MTVAEANKARKLSVIFQFCVRRRCRFESFDGGEVCPADYLIYKKEHKYGIVAVEAVNNSPRDLWLPTFPKNKYDKGLEIAAFLGVFFFIIYALKNGVYLIAIAPSDPPEFDISETEGVVKIPITLMTKIEGGIPS